MLKVDNLVAGYGQTTALDRVSIRIEIGETVTILGPNGAGKSTLMSALMGLLPARSGSITFEDESLRGLSTKEIVRRGLVLCPERRHLFPGMSVKDNLFLGAYLRRNKAEANAEFERVTALFPRLGPRLRLNAGVLSGGEQQMVAIGRALMSQPRILLLDEPSLGLAPNLVESLMDAFADLSQAGMTLCLVEQNARMALEIARRAYVLESGRVVLSGEAAEIAADDRVRSAYLGG